MYQKGWWGGGGEDLILIKFRSKWIICDYNIIVSVKSIYVIQYLERIGKKKTQQGK